MYHRRPSLREKPRQRPRTAIDTSAKGSYLITIDGVTHAPFSEAEFTQFGEQLVNVFQQIAAARHRPHDRSIAAFLGEELPHYLWEQLDIRTRCDAEVHGRGTDRVHEVMLRLLGAYAHIGLEPIESLRGDPSLAAR
jgi:hypothetical protein